MPYVGKGKTNSVLTVVTDQGDVEYVHDRHISLGTSCACTP